MRKSLLFLITFKMERIKSIRNCHIMLTVNTPRAGLVANAVGNKRPASCKILKNDNPKPFAIVTCPIATTMTFSMLYNSCYAAIPVVKFMLLLTLLLTFILTASLH